MHKVFIVIFLVLLALPALQMVHPLVKEQTLHGIEVKESEGFPEFSLKAFIGEDFQKKTHSWLSQRFGFRGHLVRTDNQINYSLFKEISSNSGTTVIVGKDDVLFEKLYIDSANGRFHIPVNRLGFVARQILRLQRLLEARGKTFLVMISPSKASVYQEYIPDNFLRDRSRSVSRESTDEFVRLLAENGVKHLDTRALIHEWKKDSEYPVFPKGGVHWTEFSACRAGVALYTRLKEISGKDIRVMRCNPTFVTDILSPFDRDLADLTNVWNPKVFYSPLPYVDTKEFVPDEGIQPRMLFVGGSFLWAILEQSERQKIYQSRDFFYYYQRRFRYPEGKETKVKDEVLEWKDDILKNDFFVLEVNEAYLHHVGMGFVRDAIKRITALDPPA